MTPAEAATRLSAAERGARSYGDANYTSAVATADPGDVLEADDEVTAEHLRREFLILADGMQELDADAATIGDALEMALVEEDVGEAAYRVRLAGYAVADAEEALAAACRMPELRPCNGCHVVKAKAIAGAEEDLAAARAALGRARQVLREVLNIAADLAGSMRAGLRRRHGGIQEAVTSAPIARAADRAFYSTRGN